jgi:hypothetical protein
MGHLGFGSIKNNFVFHFGFGKPKISDLKHPRMYAQTSFYQENLAFCFQLCTVFCCSPSFLVPWFSYLTAETDLQIWQIFFVMYGEEGGWTLFIYLQKLSLTDMFEWLLCYIQL